MMENSMLMLYVPTTLEESIVDWLLENDAVEGFSSTEVFGHGIRQSGMSLLEQVTGRQRRIQFQIQVNREQALRLVAELGDKFMDTGLYYILLPVISAGRL
jgi:hypothetical protein